ncbi:phage tail tape measure protein [Maribellus comscasis]|uniref:Phage tail tape measure protein n=1 Tax=Maribellus comscasis TaxID=2681766 RepID=A0A6I6JST5_9BACT|nr:phage tail tape measure protein [Maribellus comscasis]QGY44160.1 phage tail tape measure protein [Maribellus comscasis]
MAQTYTRRINLYINGKEVRNSVAGVSKEFAKQKAILRNLTVGTKEWSAQHQKVKNLEKIMHSYNAKMRTTSKLWQRMKGIFSSLGLVGGLTAVVSVIRNAANISKEFSQAQSNLAAVLRSTKDEIKDLTNDAIRYGTITKFTASEVTGLQTEFAKFGFTKEQIKASTKAALDFAAATNSELAPAAKVTAVALSAFDLSAANAERVASAMAVATTKSALSFEDFETILSTAGPVAKAYGFELEDLIALTGKLKDAGFDASSAATATRNIILNLADSNGKLAQALGRPIESLDDLVPALAELKARGIDLNETLQLTDKRSVSAFNTFLTAADSTLELRDGLIGVQEELQKMVDTQLDNLAGDITLLNSAWQGFILSIEEGNGILARFSRVTVKFLTDSLIKLANVDLIFKRAGKFTEDEVSRVYDAMMNLSGEKYKKLQDIVEKENKLTLEQVENHRMAMLIEIKNTGMSRKESELIWDEYYRRRQQQQEDHLKLQEEEREKGVEEAEEKHIRQATEEAEKIAEQRKKALAIEKFLQENEETQKEAIKKYFSELGEGSFEAFIEAIEKSQNEKTIDFSLVPKLPEENEETNPEGDYAIQKYQETLAFKMALNESMYQQGLIGEQQYQDQLTELTRQAEEERFEIKREKIQQAQDLANMSVNFVTALMELELEKAGENEEKKKEIKKKYADLNFAVTAAQIVASTAGAIMQGFRQLGPIGGAIAAVLLGATGAIQLGIANAQRKKVKSYAIGKYPIPADDDKTYNTVFAGRPKTGMYSGPHLGIFNEVPGQPEMVIDGITTSRIKTNAPEILDAIYSFRDGRTPSKYADGKYPETVNISSNSQTKNNSNTIERFTFALEENTKATRDFINWKPSVSVEMIEKRLKQWNEMKERSSFFQSK